MSTRRLITSIATALAEDTANQPPTTNHQHDQPQDSRHPFPDSSFPLLMTLHALLPDILLPALDLLDKRLISRVCHDMTLGSEDKPISPVKNKEKDGGQGGREVSRNLTSATEHTRRSSSSPLRSRSPLPPGLYASPQSNNPPPPQESQNPGSQSQAKDTFSSSPAGKGPEPTTTSSSRLPACWLVQDEDDETYRDYDIIRLEAWNCTCAEFAMDAYGSEDDEPARTGVEAFEGLLGDGGFGSGEERAEGLDGGLGEDDETVDVDEAEEDEAGESGEIDTGEDNEGGAKVLADAVNDVEAGDDNATTTPNIKTLSVEQVILNTKDANPTLSDTQALAGDVVEQTPKEISPQGRAETVAPDIVQETPNRVSMDADMESLIRSMADAVIGELGCMTVQDQDVEKDVGLGSSGSGGKKEEMDGENESREDVHGGEISGQNRRAGDGVSGQDRRENELESNPPEEQELSFGGPSYDGGLVHAEDSTIPCCKHLLACFLAAKCGDLLGSYVKDLRLGSPEVAGLVAGTV